MDPRNTEAMKAAERLVGRNLNEDVATKAQAPLDAALEEQQVQIMRLTDIICALCDRLKPVTRQYDCAAADINALEEKPMAVKSYVVVRISDNTASIRTMQDKLNTLMSDLDV